MMMMVDDDEDDYGDENDVNYSLELNNISQ